MTSTISVLLAFVLAGCASVIRVPLRDPRPLQNAIASNDADAVKDFLRGKSFKGESFGLQRDGIEASVRYHEERDAYAMLDLAITGSANFFGQSSPYRASSTACRSEIVKTLFDSGLVPRSEDLANAGMSACPEVIEVILPRLPPEQIKSAVSVFVKWFNNSIQQGRVQENPGWAQTFALLGKNSSDSVKALLVKAALQLDAHVRKPVRDSIAAREFVERKHKKPFCRNADLFSSLYNPPSGESIESHCLYIVHGPLKVLQVIDGGILATLMEPNAYMPEKIFLIRTKKRYVDDELVGNIIVQFDGTTQYKTVIGSVKTVQAFQYLSDIKLIQGRIYNEYDLAPNQE